MSESLPKSFVLCVSGPSGSGKTSLCDRLAEELDFAYRSISVTTRKQRSREVSGRDYVFVTPEEFLRMKNENHFVETAEVFGNWYGTPRKPLEQALERGGIIVMDIDTVGAMNVKAAFLNRCMTVFIEPPSLEELKKRLEQRKQNDSNDLEKRLEEAKRELLEVNRYDFAIINRDFDQAYAELKSFVLRQRLERS
jgi:guanylate kinase